MGKTTTPELGLVKPDYEEPVDIAEINANSDKIDARAASVGVELAGKVAQADLDAVEATLATKVTQAEVDAAKAAVEADLATTEAALNAGLATEAQIRADSDASTLAQAQAYADTIPGPQGPPGPQGDPGPDGLSAYEQAVANGFVGTEAAWIASLEGPQGPEGPRGLQGVEGPQGPQGVPGASDVTYRGVWDSGTAYVAKDQVAYLGSLYISETSNTNAVPTTATSDWTLAVQKGDTGAQGPDGPQGPQGPGGPQGPDGPAGADGVDGDSAYQIAVANGFVGTEAAWIASLEGPQGPDGLQGPDGPQGAPGDSAYEVAVAEGFVGTEQQWLASLSGDNRLTWEPPKLVNPTHVYLTNTTEGRKTGVLDANTDYIVHMPAEAITVDSGVEINGGRNVILIGGAVHYATDFTTATNERRAFFIKGNVPGTNPQPRTVHVEGVKFSGFLREGINIDSQWEPNLTVTLQNIDCSDELLGTQATNHSDFIQVYNGPTYLQVDRAYAKCGYQALMLQPFDNDLPSNEPPLFATAEKYTFKRCFFEGTDDSGALLYLVSANRPEVVTDEVYVRKAPSKSWPDQVLLEDPSFWGDGVAESDVDTVSPVTGTPGLTYTSPGYGEFETILADISELEMTTAAAVADIDAVEASVATKIGMSDLPPIPVITAESLPELGSTITVDMTGKNQLIKRWAPDQDQTINVVGLSEGQQLQLVVENSDSTLHTLSFGTGFAGTASLTGTANDIAIVTFVAVGDSPLLFQTSRVGNLSLFMGTGKALALDGVSGSYASTPYVANRLGTPDIWVEATIAPNNWTTAFAQRIISQDHTGNSARGWGFEITTDGKLRLMWNTTTANGTVEGQSSTLAVPATAGQKISVAARLMANNLYDGHTVYFYYRPAEGTSDWRILGLPVVVAGVVSSINEPNTPVEIGSREGGTNALFIGQIYDVKVRKGYWNDPIVLHFGVGNVNTSSDTTPTTFLSASGETWTLNGTSAYAVAKQGGTATRVPIGTYRWGLAGGRGGAVNRYESWIGRPVTYVMDFLADDSGWDGIRYPGWLTSHWAPFLLARPDTTMLLSIPMIPKDKDENSTAVAFDVGTPGAHGKKWIAKRNHTITTTGIAIDGHTYRLVIGNDGTPRTVTFGTGFSGVADLVGTANQWAILNFSASGGVLTETSRLTGQSSTAAQSTWLDWGSLGNFNTYFASLAQDLVARGIQNQTVLRIGWEANGGWYAWRAAPNPSAWAEMFRQVVSAARSVYSGFKVAWNPNHGYEQTPPGGFYPGDDYVDYVGPDVYDKNYNGDYPPATAATRVAAWADRLAPNGDTTSNWGITQWRNFATTHNKRLFFGEWGIDTEGNNSGHDNPDYIEHFHSLLAETDALHVYFDVEAPDGGHQLIPPTINPRSSGVYRRTFGKLSPISVIGTGSAQATGTTASVTMPDNIAEGDVVGLVISAQGDASVALPSGFTSVNNGQSGAGTADVQLKVAVKALSSAEAATPPTFTVTTNTSTELIVGYIIFRNANIPATAITTVGQGTAATTATAPELTTTEASSQGVTIAAAFRNVAGTLSITRPISASYAERLKVNRDAKGMALYVGTWNQPVVGPQGTRTFTLGASSAWSAVSFALTPKSDRSVLPALDSWNDVEASFATWNDVANEYPTGNLLLNAPQGEA